MAKTIDYATKPYAQWVEDTMREMFDIDPVAIAMEMRDSAGQVFTCYWNCDRNDMACMIDSLKDDSIIEFLRTNRDVVNEILSGEDGDEDGLCETDTEADSEG